MNPLDHQNIRVGTLHCQDRNGPATVRRDYDHVLVPECRLDLAGLTALRAVLDDAETEMIAAQAEMAEEAAEHEDDPELGCRGCAPGGSDSEHEKDCPFGPEAYKTHRPGCDCRDCKAYRGRGLT